ncbi:TlpA family protein disulfide reductase [Microscilla marina]|uniref:Thiol:disulfide interchange protein n=1 Tax=Microscilla marina ATCC 23134 TaxID=313606 RepID=A1ZHH7_MICM2|nr:TlpA disulfide reductase family protein [Microscilla marina]EAY29984.1 thiol:disulfide interchange protein [Microscilla marina ATCC 23134]
MTNQEKHSKKKKKKSLKRELIEWAVFLTVIGILWVTGWYKDLASGMQQMVLKTGFVQASAHKKEAQTTAPYNFQLRSLDGKLFNFNDLRGKTVFLNIWASWCPPCIAEMPDIHQLYKEVHSKHIKFVMLSLDDDPKKAARFIQRKGYSFPVYTQATALPPAYSSKTIPTTFVISPQGKIVVKHTGMAAYNTDKFKKLLMDVAQAKN